MEFRTESITHDRVVELLSYDPLTGLFHWKKPVSRSPSGKAGYLSKGYVLINIDKVPYFAHRLAWFFVHKEWPASEIDHKDHDKKNNRLNNLRLATRAQNCQNLPRRTDNKSGIAGVRLARDKGKWIAQLKCPGYSRHVGTFDTFEEAVAARLSAELERFGEFSPSR